MINRMVLLGRLVKRAELICTPDGNALSAFTLAVSRPFSQQSGECATDYLRIMAWGKTAEKVVSCTDEGSLVCIEGRIQRRDACTDAVDLMADHVRYLSKSQNRSRRADDKDSL